MKRILVRAPNWLGDAVMSTPFLQRLGERNPDSEIHVLCRPVWKEIFKGCPGVRQVMVFQPWESRGNLIARIRRENFSESFILPPSFSSALLHFLARIPRRVGYSTDFRRVLLTDGPPLDERFHYVRRYLGLLGEEGREIQPGDLYFPKPVNVLGSAKFFLSSKGLPGLFPALAVAPGSQAPARRWSPDRFTQLIDSLDEKAWPAVFLVGSPSDIRWCREVEERCRRKTVNVCGETGLTVLGDLLRQCAALVTNESGAMHVAWAVGTPTVVLAGPSETRVTSPFNPIPQSFGDGRSPATLPSGEVGELASGLRYAPVRVIQHREVPCVPCVRNDCFRPADEYKECMKKIEVEEVREALKEVLRTER